MSRSHVRLSDFASLREVRSIGGDVIAWQDPKTLRVIPCGVRATCQKCNVEFVRRRKKPDKVKSDVCSRACSALWAAEQRKRASQGRLARMGIVRKGPEEVFVAYDGAFSDPSKWFMRPSSKRRKEGAWVWEGRINERAMVASGRWRPATLEESEAMKGGRGPWSAA